MTKTDKTTYVMERKNGEQRRVTVPAKWRVTFGPTVPYERKTSGSYGQECWSVRLYDNKDLKACFTDVVAFRCMDEIVVSEKRIKTQRQTVRKASKRGEKDVVAEARIEEWVDPDNEPNSAEDEDFLRLDYLHK